MDSGGKSTIPQDALQILDINNICRACLSAEDTMKDLFTACSGEVFKYCTSVEISEMDELPRLICVTCLDLLNQLYYFKQVVIRSNTILRQQSSTQVISDSYNQCYSENECGSKQIEKLEVPASCVDGQDLSSQKEKVKHVKRELSSRKYKKKYRNRLKCVKCDKTFQKYENLEAHMRSHFGKKPDIECSECKKKFNNLNSLNIHMRVHNGIKKYQCLTCGKKFGYLNVLKNHEKMHAGIKKYMCHLCDAKFVQPYNLKTHLRTHNGEKLYGCNQCGKRFTQPGNLKVHLIRHTGIKNIACHLCDMRFYVKGDLDKHMKSHYDVKPFACELCDKSFKSRSFLTIHMRTHTGERPYTCDLCPMKFMCRKELRNHRMTHTGEKPHKCQLCSQAFIQKSALNRHMKCHLKQCTAEQENIIIQRTEQLNAVDNITPVTVSYSEWQQVA